MMAYSGHIMTLANSIIGVGILAMPFCFQKCGIVLSVLLLIISNWITRICCHYLIKSSLLTRRKSFEVLGFHAFGASGKLLAELCIIGYLFGTSITYFVVMGDLGPQIASKLFALNIEDFPHLRTWVMICVTIFCILPLAMLKNVDSLSTVCAASIGFYVCLVLKIVLESGEHIVAQDWADKVEYWRPAGILQCLPIYSMALSCQMQLFEVFESINNQSVEKLNGIVRNATWICTFVYIAVGLFGYIAFCTQTFSGNILLNFTPSFGSDVIKIGFVLSVAFSFPLVVFPCRASLYSLLYRKGHTDNAGYIPETRFKVITTCLVSCALCIALIIPSVELVIGLVGSTIGVVICIMFPALCFRKIVKKDSTERTLAQFIYVGGFCLMILGTVANLNAIDDQRSGAHLHVSEEFHDTMLVRPTEKVNTFIMDAALLQPQRDNPKNINVTPVQPISRLPVGNDELKLKQDMMVENKSKDLKIIISNPVELNINGEDVKESKPETDQQLDAKPKELNFSANPSEPQQPNMNQQSQSEARKFKQQEQALQQVIDKDAIKKDEEIAAEELKNVQKQSKNKNDVELKETQKELKQTKELLERTVDQLKQELAKQNEETKNLVVEKLEKVVQKVEQIEKKVIQNKPEQPSIMDDNMNVKTVSHHSGNLVKNEYKQNESKLIEDKKGVEDVIPLLKMLSEHQLNEAANENKNMQVKIFEEVKNGSKLEQSLPLPLALLFNASNIKVNNKSNINVREVVANQLNIVPHSMANNASAMINAKIENTTLVKLVVSAPHEKEKDNKEAIRRDILQLDIEATAAATNSQHFRQKRSNDKTFDFDAIDSKLTDNNYLVEPKVEELIGHGGLSNTIDFKMQNIGRELRSLNDNN